MCFWSETTFLLASISFYPCNSNKFAAFILYLLLTAFPKKPMLISPYNGGQHGNK